MSRTHIYTAHTLYVGTKPRACTYVVNNIVSLQVMSFQSLLKLFFPESKCVTQVNCTGKSIPFSSEPMCHFALIPHTL
jgi:hypothetical protein